MFDIKKIKSFYRSRFSEKTRFLIWNLMHPFSRKIKIVSYAVSNEMKFDVIPSRFWNDFNHHLWEPETRIFYKKYVLPTKEIIDIGGWIGPTMMIAYSYNPKKIYVVEADPANYQILKQNVFKNLLNDKVELYNVCIGNKNDEIVSFGYTDENFLDTSTKGIGGNRVKVKTATLEDFLKTKDMSKINIIKIDTEGAEQYMEKGLAYISQFPDITVLFSIHGPFWNDKQKTANMLLEQFKNYDVFTDKEEKITENELLEKMLSNDTIAFLEGKTGLFFTVILKTKIGRNIPKNT